MTTVEDVNNSFAQKGIHIQLPLPSHFQIRNVSIIEKKRAPAGVVKLILNVKFLNDHGKEISDIFLCEGEVDAQRQGKVTEKKVHPLPKSELLPLREKTSFEDEADARAYLREAITHLLRDKGYSPAEQTGIDIYFQKGERGLVASLVTRCDEEGFRRAKELIELRRSKGVAHDYGLVIPSLQESLGISLADQDGWIWRNQEYLSGHRIGVYAVDNLDPNWIYAFTIYPDSRELKEFFMAATPRWSTVRDRYLQTKRISD